MTAVPYILARSFTQAHAFARSELGLVHGQYRVVTSAGTLKAVRGATLHLVPDWKRRFDRFQMESALRWTRMEVIDHTEDLAEEPELDDLNPPGVQSEITEGADPALVEQFEAFLNSGEHPHEEAEPEQAEESAPAESKRRRRRCKECGLLVDPDEVDAHAAEHLPSE